MALLSQSGLELLERSPASSGLSKVEQVNMQMGIGDSDIGIGNREHDMASAGKFGLTEYASVQRFIWLNRFLQPYIFGMC